MNKLKLKSVLAISLLILSANLHAQTIEEGIKMYSYERYESAKKILEPLSAANPLANYYWGLSELGLENVSAAKAIFQKYPEDNANSSGIARVLFSENKSPEAMSILTKIAGKAKKKNWDPFKYAADAITYSEGGDPNVAVEWYKKAIEVEPKGEIYIAMGDAYRKMQGGGGNAMTNYEYADTYPTTTSIANYKMGNLWYAAKNYDSALTKYNRSSDLDEANPLPFKALADAYYKIKKYKISKEKIEKYLERSDKSTLDQIEYANTLFLAQDYTNAINKMNELVTKGEGDKRPYMYRVLGYSYFETKDCPKALINMDKFFAKIEQKKIIPSDYTYYGKIMLCDTLTASKAGAYFDKGIALDTTADKAPLYKKLAESFFEAENYAVSAQYYEKVLNSNSPTIEALDYWWGGAMYYYNKSYVKADSIYKIMGEKFPEEPSSFVMRANITVVTKDKDYKNGAATELYTKWLSMVKFEDPEKKKNLVKAYTYLAMVAYNSNKKEETLAHVAKLQLLNPADDTAAQLTKALEGMK